MNLTLKVWRQKGPQGNGPRDKGRMVTYDAPGISPDMSFLEMLDIVNAKLELAGEEPIAFDRIMQAGGFISVNTGGKPDANCLPVSKEKAELSMDAAACIDCGACVASCKNASAMLFVSAKVAQFAYLPQGPPERYERVQPMIAAMDHEGFGNCTNQGECEAVCPKEIKMTNIALMNRDFLVAVAASGARQIG